MNVVSKPLYFSDWIPRWPIFISYSFSVLFFMCGLPRNSTGAMVRSLQDSLAVLSVELTPIHEKLVTVRRQLVALAAKEGSHKAELKPLQEELRKIDSLSAQFTSHVYFFVHAETLINFSTLDTFRYPLIIFVYPRYPRYPAQKTSGWKIPRTQRRNTSFSGNMFFPFGRVFWDLTGNQSARWIQACGDFAKAHLWST